MGEKSDLHRLYITVNPAKTVRCGWCGAFQSDQWQQDRGGTFCSKSCQSAAVASNKCILPLCVIIFSTPVIFFMKGVDYGVTFSIPAILVGIWMLSEYRRGKEAALKIPKGSRMKEGLDDLSVLKTVLKHVECPNCDGNIDIDEIKPGLVYHCRYCGASGVIEITFTHER